MKLLRKRQTCHTELTFNLGADLVTHTTWSSSIMFLILGVNSPLAGNLSPEVFWIVILLYLVCFCPTMVCFLVAELILAEATRKQYWFFEKKKSLENMNAIQCIWANSCLDPSIGLCVFARLILLSRECDTGSGTIMLNEFICFDAF